LFWVKHVNSGIVEEWNDGMVEERTRRTRHTEARRQQEQMPKVENRESEVSHKSIEQGA